VRRLDMVHAIRQTLPSALRQSKRSTHSRATSLPRPFHTRLQEVQPLPDRGTASRLHRCGGEGVEPSAAGSVGFVDRAAILDAQRWRASECVSQVKKYGNCHTSASAAACYQINLGTTPGCHRAVAGATPSEGQGRLRSAAESKSRGIRAYATPEACRANTVASRTSGGPFVTVAWASGAETLLGRPDKPPRSRVALIPGTLYMRGQEK
jgi:hypothetical protein